MPPLKISKKLLNYGRFNISSIFSYLGQITGLILFATLTILYFAYQEVSHSKDGFIGENYLIINKKISLLNTLNIQKSTTFNESEMNKIQSCKGVKAIGSFQRNHFQAYGSLLFNQSEIQGFQTDLFMESVPNEFIEIPNANWQWKNGDEIPIILPAEFLNLYNLNYAPSRGLPQISQSMLKLIRLQIKIHGNGETAIFTGKIVGFTHRIQSILVPQQFLSWANTHYSNEANISNNKIEPQRIIIKTNSSNPQEIIDYINNNQLETNQELLKSTRFYYVVISILTGMFFIGFILLFNALSSSIFNFKLHIEKLSYEIDTLKIMGFPTTKLIQIFTKPMLIANGVILVISCIFVVLIHSWINQIFSTVQLEITHPLTTFGILSCIITQIITAIISFLAISNAIKKENP